MNDAESSGRVGSPSGHLTRLVDKEFPIESAGLSTGFKLPPSAASHDK